jgi:hypothetical protein
MHDVMYVCTVFMYSMYVCVCIRMYTILNNVLVRLVLERLDGLGIDNKCIFRAGKIVYVCMYLYVFMYVFIYIFMHVCICTLIEVYTVYV